MKCINRVWAFGCCLTVAAQMGAAAVAGVVTWDGGAGTENWSDELNWSTDSLPGPTDDVVIDVVGDITVRHNSGATEIASLICEETFVMQAGTLESSGDFTFNGPFEWTAGTMAGDGSTTCNGGMTLAGSTRDLWRDLTNNGTCTWTSGVFRISFAKVFSNPVGSLFDVQGDLTLTIFSNPAGIIDNAGEIRRSSGAGQLVVGVEVNNTGLIDIQTGSMRVQRPFDNAGDLIGNEIDFTSTVTVPASGAVDVLTGKVSAGTTTIDGTFLVDAYTQQGGTMNLNPGSTVDLGTDYVHNGGTMNYNSGTDVIFDSGFFASGTFDGTTNLIFNGPLDWNAGTIRGDGTITCNGGMTLAGSTRDLWRDLTNNGTCTWTSGVFRISFGKVFSNPVGSLLDVQGDLTLTIFSNPAGIIDNAGEIRRSSGDGQFTVGVEVNNTGLIDIQTGSMMVQRPLLQTAGETRVTGTLLWSGLNASYQGGRLGGVGTIASDLDQFTSVIHPGNSPGTLTVDGDYECASDGTLEIEIAGLAPGTDHDVLLVSDTATLDGEITIAFIDGFDPIAGDTVTILEADNIKGSFPCFDLPNLPGRRINLLITSTTVTVLVIDGTECDADLNLDNQVDTVDLLLMLGSWGKVTACSPADINDDEMVDVVDLLVLLGAWGPCS